MPLLLTLTWMTPWCLWGPGPTARIEWLWFKEQGRKYPHVTSCYETVPRSPWRLIMPCRIPSYSLAVSHFPDTWLATGYVTQLHWLVKSPIYILIWQEMQQPHLTNWIGVWGCTCIRELNHWNAIWMWKLQFQVVDIQDFWMLFIQTLNGARVTAFSAKLWAHVVFKSEAATMKRLFIVHCCRFISCLGPVSQKHC